MARHKSHPIFIDLIEMASLIPWWASFILALLSYLGFHYVAGIPISTPQGLQGLSDSTIQTVYVTASKYLQYLIPIACLIGGIVSIFKRKKRYKLLQSQTGIESIRSMSWQEF